MNHKLLALYGLKWNPFTPEVPVEALHVSARLESFCWRIEHAQVREGGFALIHGEPGSGKSVALRVLAQRLYVLNSVPKKEQATLTQLDFKEPLRWRDGHLNRDLFRGMLVEDLRARPGCDMLFEREGNGFKAAVGSGCRASARDTGETLRVEQRMQLGPEVLAIFEQHRDAAGVGVFQQACRVQQRGLARTRGADEADDLAGRHVQIDAAQDG